MTADLALPDGHMQTALRDGVPRSLEGDSRHKPPLVALARKRGLTSGDMDILLTKERRRRFGIPISDKRDAAMARVFHSAVFRRMAFWSAMSDTGDDPLAAELMDKMAVEDTLLETYAPAYRLTRYERAALEMVCPAWPQILQRMNDDDSPVSPSDGGAGFGAFMLWPQLAGDLARFDALEQERRVAAGHAVFALSSISGSDWFIRQALVICPALGDEFGHLVAPAPLTRSPDEMMADRNADSLAPVSSDEQWQALGRDLSVLVSEWPESPRRGIAVRLADLGRRADQMAALLPPDTPPARARLDAQLTLLIAELESSSSRASFDWLDASLRAQVVARWLLAGAADLGEDDLARLAEDAFAARGRLAEAAAVIQAAVEARARAEAELRQFEDGLSSVSGLQLAVARTSPAMSRLKAARDQAESELLGCQLSLLAAASPWAEKFDPAAGYSFRDLQAKSDGSSSVSAAEVGASAAAANAQSPGTNAVESGGTPLDISVSPPMSDVSEPVDFGRSQSSGAVGPREGEDFPVSLSEIGSMRPEHASSGTPPVTRDGGSESEPSPRSEGSSKSDGVEVLAESGSDHAEQSGTRASGLGACIQGGAGLPEAKAAPNASSLVGEISGLGALADDGDLGEASRSPASVNSGNEIGLHSVPAADALHPVGGPAGQRVSSVPQPDDTAPPLAYRDYRDCHYVDAAGRVAIAPWRETGFSEFTNRRLLAAWARGAYGLAHLHALAVEANGGIAAVPSVLFEALAARLFATDPALGRGRAAAAATGRAGDQGPGHGALAALALEALRAGEAPAVSDAELSELLPPGDPANELVRWMLECRRAGESPVDLLIEHQGAPTSNQPAVARAEAIAAMDHFAVLVQEYWSAAGGAIQQTHCRRTWTAFVEDTLRDFRDRHAALASKTPDQAAQGAAERLEAGIEDLLSRYREAMDEGGVRLRDRNAADRTMTHLVAALRDAVQALRRLGLASNRGLKRSQSLTQLPEGALRAVLGSGVVGGDRGIVHIAVSAAVGGDVSPDLFRIPASVLGRTPSCALYLVEESLRADETSAAGWPMEAVADPRALSALTNFPDADDEPVLTVAAAVAAWREEAVRSGRLDVISRLIGRGIVGTELSQRLYAETLQQEERLEADLAELHRCWVACDALVGRDADRIRSLLEQAEATFRTMVAGDQLSERLIFSDWLDRCLRFAKQARQHAEDRVLEAAVPRGSQVGKDVRSLLEQSRHREALQLVQTGDELPAVEVAVEYSGRVTLWRDEACDRYRSPLEHIASLSASGAVGGFVQQWGGALHSQENREVLQGRLAELLVEGVQRAERARLRQNSRPHATLSCMEIRRYFQRMRLNPTFVPQVADWGRIEIIPAPAQTLQSSVGNWLSAALSVLAKSGEDTVVVFVAPGLQQAQRAEHLKVFRKRGLRAGILDDVDACRLLDVVARDSTLALVAFLEVVLEQLPLGRISPFSTQDGQHIRLETFVGRADEAAELATTAKYSRIFSGRKLGKTALLKFVEARFDGTELPSGNTLHVLFGTIAGAESEDAVARIVADLLAQRFPSPATRPTAQVASARLEEYVRQVLSANPKVSLLVVLDEADSFVESQLIAFGDKGESSLSWCLLKVLSSLTDANGHPRVRFVFSGYRATNIAAGVWANGGQTQVLRPLSERDGEAERLIESLFARIGVDLGNHASYIARRCGRQPAVLIRFGEALLRRLDSPYRAGDRERIRVSDTLVASALGDSEVADEVRTVVANNFQGDRLAGAVFYAVLLCLQERPPGAAITGGAEEVIDRLMKIDPDQGRAIRFGPSPVGFVGRLLDDFVKRELLEHGQPQGFQKRQYRLKCPHFLPILLSGEDLEGAIRERLQEARDRPATSVEVHSALSSRTLDRVRYAFELPDTELCRAIAVGGHWVQPMVDPRCGLAVSLAASGAAAACPEAPSVPIALARGVRVLEGPPISAWDSVVAHGNSRPLIAVGNVRWLRKALDHCFRGSEPPLDYAGQGVFSHGAIRWWLEVGRALHVQDIHAIVDRWARLTGGVPLLMWALDAEVQGPLGGELTVTAFEAAAARFEQSLPQLVIRWVRDGSVLERREWELFALCAEASAQLGSIDLEADVSDEFIAEVGGELGVNPPYRDSGTLDRTALAVLLLSGMLPPQDEATVLGTRGLGSIKVENGTAVHRLAGLVSTALRTGGH